MDNQYNKPERPVLSAGAGHLEKSQQPQQDYRGTFSDEPPPAELGAALEGLWQLAVTRASTGFRETQALTEQELAAVRAQHAQVLEALAHERHRNAELSRQLDEQRQRADAAETALAVTEERLAAAEQRAEQDHAQWQRTEQRLLDTKTSLAEEQRQLGQQVDDEVPGVIDFVK